MKIYVAHSTNCDYVNEIYEPIRANGDLKKYDIILPHEENDFLHTRDYYSNFDLAICEVSNASTGLGIELGFLYDSNVPIYCFYKKGSHYSKAIQAITESIFTYEDTVDFINKIKKIIESR